MHTFTPGTKDAYADSHQSCWCLYCSRRDPACGSPSSSQGLQGRLPNLSAKTAGWVTWKGAREAWGEGTALGSEACGGDRCPGGCVGRSAPSHTFWASLNSHWRNAHLDTTFSKIGRKRNNGGEGGGHRKKHTHTQTKINFWRVLWNHNKGPADCFITSSWGKTPGIIFYLAVILLHYSFSQVFQHVCRSESTNAKTWMYRYTWKSAELTQLRHVSKCLR